MCATLNHPDKALAIVRLAPEEEQEPVVRGTSRSIESIER